jgi:proteasome accessory factor C
MSLQSRTPKRPVERVFSLVTTLLRSRRGLTRKQILDRMEEFYGHADARAQRRMFLRDKDLAREWGFPIVTEVDDEDAPEDERHVYRIDATEQRALSVTLTATQRDILVATADMVLDDPAFPMREDMAMAVHKLLMAGGGYRDPSQCSCRVQLQQPAGVARGGARRWMGPLTDAVRGRYRLRIGYTDARGVSTRREIDPWGLAFVRGEWRLAAFCHLREDVRVFAVHRIAAVSRVRRSGRPVRFRMPAGRDPRAIVNVEPWRYSVHPAERVTLRADDDFRWYASRLLGVEPTGGLYRLEATNTDFLVRTALRYGPRIRVESPPRLVEEVARRATRMGSRDGWGRARGSALARRRRSARPLARRASTGVRRRLGITGFLVAYLAAHREVRLETLARILDMEVPALVTLLERLATCGVYPSLDNDLYGIIVSPESGVVSYTHGPAPEMERPARLEHREVAALIVGLKWITDCMTPPFDYEAHALVDRFLEQAGRDLGSLAADLERRIAVGGPGGPDWHTFLDVSRAVLDRRKLDITYWSISRGELSRRTVRPYVVVNRLGMWYVSGYCESARRIRTFRFDRIRAHRLERARFSRPADFDPRAHLDGGIHPDAAPPAEQRVVVAFDPAWVARNAGREGHEFLDRFRDGTITFAVDPSRHEGFLSWLSWTTTRFDVVEPAALRRAMLRRRAEILAAHGSADPAAS